MFDFEYLNDQFLRLGAVNSVAELQGLICGKLAGGKVPPAEEWRQEGLRFMELLDLQSGEGATLFDLLLERTKQSLDDGNFSFQPLLPDDRTVINRRVDELGMWCRGYLCGLGTAGLRKELLLSPDIAGALRDLAEIANITLEGDVESEENEVYWTELVEYVKVAVLNIYAELNTCGANQPFLINPNNPPLH